MRTLLIAALVIFLFGGLPAMAQDAIIIHPADNRDPRPGPVGDKPYEMAGRKEERTPLFDFRNVSGWEVVGVNAEGQLYRSQERRLYGEYCGKLTYLAHGANPSLLVRPKRPLPLPDPWDAVNLWTWGNNWGWVPDPGTPPVWVAAVVADATGREFEIPLGVIDYQYWFLMNGRLHEPERSQLARPATFRGLLFTGGTNPEPRAIYLGPIYFFREQRKPLDFAPWPEKLPFPIRPETILPSNPTKEFTNAARLEGDTFVFSYRGRDRDLEYRYHPTDATLGDIELRYGDTVVRPLTGGGVQLVSGGRVLVPSDASVTRGLLDKRLEGEAAVVRWRLSAGDVTTEVSYRISLQQKSLIVEMSASQPVVERVVLGRVEPVTDPQLIWVPYLTYGGNDPHVLCADGLFFFTQFDWYYSDASRLYGGRATGPDWAVSNGGAEYTPKTDGTRNLLRERLLLTVSPHFHEVLPTIPNPPSPYREVQGERLWRVKMGNDYPVELAEARQLRALGCDKVTVRYHEDCWRDAGESFTFRVEAAPGRGGDPALRQFVSDIKSLGWRIGLYTNYTDFAPVNSNWDEDWVNRLPYGDWQRAWPRCYASKPMRAAEAEAVFAPRIHAKFGENHSYCDVHTCVSPFDRVDYDARVPGAATFRRTFECYGRLLYNEKLAHHGPVYSEGTNHWWYAGLVDGNYGQINHAQPSQVPLLVDFDLLKLHPLEMDAGMGAPGMFFRDQPWNLDQFIATTLAYGHIGFLEWSDLPGTLKIYYLLQQLQSRYAMVPVQSIAYWDGAKFVPSSQAMRVGAYRNNRVHVVYGNGTEVYVNGDLEPWTVTAEGRSYLLPHWGYLAFRTGEVLVYSAEVPLAGPEEARGPRARVDVSLAKEQMYADSRGGFAFLGPIGVAGSAALKREEGHWWVIPTTQGVDFALDPKVIGLADGDSLEVSAISEPGPRAAPEVRWSREMAHLLPNDQAVKYQLRPVSRPRPAAVTCDTKLALPGEEVCITLPDDLLADPARAFWEIDRHRIPAVLQPTGEVGRFACAVPSDHPTGEHVWLGLPVGDDVRWLDFIVAEPLQVSLQVAPAELRRGQSLTAIASLRNNLDETVTVPLGASCSGGAVVDPPLREVTVAGGESVSAPLAVMLPWEERAFEISAWTGRGQRRAGHAVIVDTGTVRPVLLDLTDPQIQPLCGYCLRGGAEVMGLTSGYDGSFFRMEEKAGGEALPAIFAHPPWGEGRAGYVFATYHLHLPADSHPAFTFSLGIRDGYATTDGVVYQVIVIGPDSAPRLLWSQQYQDHRWQPATVDLSAYAGQHITLKLVTDCGPSDDTTSDHALWGEPQVVDQQERLKVTGR